MTQYCVPSVSALVQTWRFLHEELDGGTLQMCVIMVVCSTRALAPRPPNTHTYSTWWAACAVQAYFYLCRALFFIRNSYEHCARDG